ncbi:hypothetical protein ACFL2A_07030, partial [Thermodesulfobacteriota bacterium]
DKKGVVIYAAEHEDIDYKELEKIIENNLVGIMSKLVVILVSLAAIIFISIMTYMMFIKPRENAGEV